MRYKSLQKQKKCISGIMSTHQESQHLPFARYYGRGEGKSLNLWFTACATHRGKLFNKEFLKSPFQEKIYVHMSVVVCSFIMDQ